MGKSRSRILSHSSSFLSGFAFCFEKRDGREKVGAMRAAGGEVGDGFADHAVGEAGSGDSHEAVAFGSIL